jgi:tRNA A22 N-methylase
LIYKIVLIALKRFSFRITFIRVGIYFGPLLAKHKRESLAIKLLNSIFRLYAIQNQLRKAVIEEQGRLALG